MEEELNENLELENKEVPNNEDLPEVSQDATDLQVFLNLKDEEIAQLKQQLNELKPLVKSENLFKEVEKVLITADELRNEKLPELSQKIQEYVYYLGKNNLSDMPGVTVGSVNNQKKESLKAEVNGLLKVLGNLELK